MRFFIKTWLASMFFVCPLWAQDSDPIMNLQAPFKVSQKLTLPKDFNVAADLTRLADELRNQVNVDAFTICDDLFSGDNSKLFSGSEKTKTQHSSDGTITATGDFLCSLSFPKSSLKYHIPNLLEALADGRTITNEIAISVLLSAKAQHSSLKKLIENYYAQLSPRVQRQIRTQIFPNSDLAGEQFPADLTKPIELPVQSSLKFRNYSDWTDKAVAGIQAYLKIASRKILENNCASLSGFAGKLIPEESTQSFLRTLPDSDDFSEFRESALCKVSVAPEVMRKNLRTLHSRVALASLENLERLKVYDLSHLEISSSQFWIQELSGSVPYSDRGKFYLFNLLTVAPLATNSRMAVLDSLRSAFIEADGLNDSLGTLIKAWKQDSINWLEGQLLEKHLSRKAVGQWLGNFDGNQIKISLLEEVAKAPEASLSVVSALDRRTFDGSESALFPTVLSVAKEAIKQNQSSGMPLRVLGKFRKTEALSVLNDGLLVGGLHLSLSANPDFVSSTLDGIEFSRSVSSAKQKLPNLIRVANEYFNHSIATRARNLIPQLAH